MSRSASRKTRPSSDSEREASVVRTAKSIPTMEKRPLIVEEPPRENPALPCSGRCGHCHLDPCQLHAPI